MCKIKRKQGVITATFGKRTSEFENCHRLKASMTTIALLLSDMVRELVKTTQLHKLLVIYRGTEMIACEEIEEENKDKQKKN